MEIQFEYLNKLLRSNLSFEEGVLLWLIRNKYYSKINDFGKEHFTESMVTVFKTLERKGFIKIVGNNLPEDIEFRQEYLNLLISKHVITDIVTVIEYLNLKTGKKFDTKSEANRKFVQARLNQKYTVEDCKRVIDVMCKEWKGTKMEVYLRPATLFNAEKFESYVNRQPTSSKDTNQLFM